MSNPGDLKQKSRNNSDFICYCDWNASGICKSVWSCYNFIHM